MQNRIAMIAVAATLAGVLAGCTKDEEPVNIEPGPKAAKDSKLVPPALSTEEMAKAHSETKGAGQAELATLTKSHEAAKAAFEKSPSDDKVKKAYVDATVKLGTATMMSPDLSPREKYSGALKLYREALKVDPKNKEALENKMMIEDIYKQMGRPVPE